jgi:hypothetical protein
MWIMGLLKRLLLLNAGRQNGPSVVLNKRRCPRLLIRRDGGLDSRSVRWPQSRLAAVQQAGSPIDRKLFIGVFRSARSTLLRARQA